jgi:WD40 repeat protein
MIEGHGLAVWQDIPDMEAGAWWEQIKKVLSAPTTEHMVLVVSRDALASKVVRDEWRFARREGVQVSPLLVPDKLGAADFDAMPGSMKAQHFFDIGKPEHAERLIAGLKGPSRQVRAPQMAPEPEAHFVLRTDEGDRLLALLIEGENAAVGITAALRGAGGYGKTQLARWLAHQEAIEDAFYDGILWVELGEHPKVHDKVEGLIYKLTVEKPGLPDAAMAAARLKEAIGDRHMLLVIDDVWNKSDLDPFLGGAPNLVRLVTTRFDHVLPHDAAKVAVDAMQPAEAVELLTVGPAGLFPPAAVEGARAALVALAKRLGEWPLLLTLANALLRAEVEGSASVEAAIAYVTRLYDEAGLGAFDSGNEEDRNSAARLSIGASLKRLDAGKGEVARFEELALFPEDADIPAATITRLWQATGSLAPFASEVLLRSLMKWALLLSYQRTAGTVRLHDVVRKFLRDRVGEADIARHAQAFVAAYASSTGADLAGAERLYYYRHLPQHLHEAGDLARLDALLMSPAWMQAKLAAAGARPLIDDYRYARTESQRLTGQALDLAGGALARDERQLVAQILGRMREGLTEDVNEATAVRGLRRSACMHAMPPVMAPSWAIFTAPGGPEVRRFEGHGGGVSAVAFSPDGRHLVSGSDDRTLRLWEVVSGAARVLEGHGGWVRAVAFSPDSRRFVSGSNDGTVRLWEVASGAARVLQGHGGWVRAVAFSPDGCHVASGSNDGTVRLWEVTSGAARVLQGHGGWVNAVAFSPDGRHAVSGSDDGTLRLWEVESGAARVLEGHGGSVNAVAFSPDGRHLVSGSDDDVLRLWEVASGDTRVLEVHGGSVNAVAFSPDGRHVASGSDDGTLRLWEVASGDTRVLKGHGGSVKAVAF